MFQMALDCSNRDRIEEVKPSSVNEYRLEFTCAILENRRSFRDIVISPERFMQICAHNFHINEHFMPAREAQVALLTVGVFLSDSNETSWPSESLPSWHSAVFTCTLI